MPEPQLAVIADDLTGASDAAIPFALAGLNTMVSLGSQVHPRADVLAIATHSRNLTGDEAARLSAQAAIKIQGMWGARRAGWIYKKIDSTLRGHPGAELIAVMGVLGAERALVAPAFPAQGRTTVDGKQLVHGDLLENTSFGPAVGASSVASVLGRYMPGVPVHRIDLAAVRAGARAIVQKLQSRSPAVFIADAVTEADLLSLARAAVDEDIRLLCGSAGLARALSKTLQLTPRVRAPGPPVPRKGGVLVVAGSRHPSTVRQVEAARRQGVAVICPSEWLLSVPGETIAPEELQAVAYQLSKGRDLVLTTSGLPTSPYGCQNFVSRLGRITKGFMDDNAVGGLVLTGGDTALAVLATIGGTKLWLGGEVEPGIPWGTLLDGGWPGLTVATKSGGFGTGDALVRTIQRLHGMARPADVVHPS